jgi:hypothetical protein
MPGFAPGKVRATITMETPGTYALRGYPSAPAYRLETHGFVPLEVRFRVQAGARTVRPSPVLFSKGGRIAGTVTLTGAARRVASHVYYEPVRGGETAIRFIHVSGGGEYVIKGLAPGRYRLWAFASGFRAGKTEVTVGDGETRKDFSLTLRDPTDPPAPATRAYAECKGKTISISLMDVPFEEMVDWIREMTGADLRLRPDIDKSEDEMMVQLQVDRIPLGEMMKLVVSLKGLKVDEQKGEIHGD